MTPDDLEDFMREKGIGYRLPYIGSFATADHIWLIAEFLREPPANLFKHTKHTGDLVKSVFEERWPFYETLVGMSKSQAWDKIVEGREFSGEQGRAAIRGYIDLILDGLLPTPVSTSSVCEPLECFECPKFCERTGEQIANYL